MKCEYCRTRKATTKATGTWGKRTVTLDVCAYCAMVIVNNQKEIDEGTERPLSAGVGAGQEPEFWP